MSTQKQLSSQGFETVYKSLGISIDKLGSVLLDLEPITPKDLGYDKKSLPLYESKNKDRTWISGWVSEKIPHVTLLYGLLDQAYKIKSEINAVLSGWGIKSVEIEDVGFFESPYPDEKYWCIIAKVKQTPNLIQGHQRLQFLPHINTFSTYKPHITLCYIDRIAESDRDRLIGDFRKILKNKSIKVTGLNYGE